MTTLAFSILSTGCSFGLYYDDADKYTMGGATLEERVTGLDVEWIDGHVTVQYTQTAGLTSVTFSEESTKTLTNMTSMYYWLDGGTLRIRYAKAVGGCTGGNYPAKDLTITLPLGDALAETDIETVNADITFENIASNKVSLDSVSGKIVGGVHAASRLEVNTVSGNVGLSLTQVNEADVATVSGNVELFASNDPPDSGKISSVSGDVSLLLNTDYGYTISYSSVSGRFESALAGTTQDKKWTYGDGAKLWKVDTTSGDIRVQSTK